MFGSTVSGRGGELAGTESIVGLLINTLPVPMAWDHARAIAAVMADLQDQQSAVLDAQHLGLAELARLAGVREFFDTMVVVENFPTVASEPRMTLGHCTSMASPAPTHRTTRCPCRVIWTDRLTVEIKYDTGAVPRGPGRQVRRTPSSASGVHRNTRTPAVRANRRPERDLVSGTTSRPRPHARRRLPPPPPRTQTAPRSAAVRTITYAQLDERASAVAATLTALGVRPSPGSPSRCHGRWI